MTKNEARQLTERIKTAHGELGRLILQAHHERAWSALGCKSFAAYASDELNMSRQHAYRLIDHARVVAKLEEALADVSPTGDNVVNLSEYATRKLKTTLPWAADDIRSRVLRGEKPGEAIARTIRALRDAPDDGVVVEDFGERVRECSERIGKLASDDNLGRELAEFHERVMEIAPGVGMELVSALREAAKRLNEHAELFLRHGDGPSSTSVTQLPAREA